MIPLAAFSHALKADSTTLRGCALTDRGAVFTIGNAIKGAARSRLLKSDQDKKGALSMASPKVESTMSRAAIITGASRGMEH